jgi:hypothetical protein
LGIGQITILCRSGENDCQDQEIDRNAHKFV